MSTTVVTTWSAQQAEVYGKEWLLGAAASWPDPWQVFVYGAIPPCVGPLKSRWVEFREERTAEVAALTGEQPELEGRVPVACWRPAEREAGYSFRTDARRFAWKVFALLHAWRTVQTDVLVWLDADVRTRPGVNVPADLWDRVSPWTVGWLDRPGRWVETGCLVFRLPAADPVLVELASYYENPAKLFALPQWHDGWVMTQVLRTVGLGFPMATQPPGAPGDVWDRCPLLHRYFTHEKGFARKRAAYGMEVL